MPDYASEWEKIGMSLGGSLGHTSSDIVKGVILKKYGAKVEYEKQLQLKSLTSGIGPYRDKVTDEWTLPEDMQALSEQEKRIVFDAAEKHEQERYKLMQLAGKTVLEEDKHLEDLQNKATSFEHKLMIARQRTTNWAQPKKYGVNNPWRTSPIDFEAMLLQGQNLKDGIGEEMLARMAKIREGGPEGRNAYNQLMSLVYTYPDEAKNMGIDPGKSYADYQTKQMTVEEQMDVKKKEAEKMQGVQIAGKVKEQAALLPGEIKKARELAEVQLDTAEKKASGKQYVYSNDTYLVAKSLGIDPEDVAKGNVTQDQADQILSKKNQLAVQKQVETRITTEELLKSRDLGTYGSHRIIQTDKGAYYVAVRPDKGGKPIPITDAQGQPLAKPIPSEQMSRISDLLTLKANNEEVQKLYNPSYVGPVAGRWAGLKEKLVDLPEPQVQFYAYVRDNQDALLRARSGAQINEQEFRRLVAFLPDPNLPSGNFMARQKRFEKEVEIVLGNKVKMLGVGGYGTVSMTEQPKESQDKTMTESKRFKILKVE